MPDYAEIYRRQAGKYEALVSREDYQGNLLPALEQIVPLRDKVVVDLGAGTGRLACLLAPLAASVLACDASGAMLSVAAKKLQAGGPGNWLTAVADHRAIPLPNAVADVALSGWSICYLVVWNETRWQAELGRGLEEMQRLVRPGGYLVILETLGTGTASPRPPENLEAYFTYLEEEGFRRTWLRTDYHFASQEEAESLLPFFFGEEMLAKTETRGGEVFLPECTGIWSFTNS